MEEKKQHMMKYQRVFSIAVIVAILMLAAYLRLYKISQYMTFLGDEGRDVLIVKRMIVDHKFTLLGPTASVGGFFLGPIYYYFMLPFLWLWRLDPTGPAVMVALFGVATVYLVYRVGKDLFDYWTGLIASSLYAVSPLVIAYSRSSWNPNLVPFFSTLLIYLWWGIAVKGKLRNLFWIGVVLGIGLQLHYLFLFLIFFSILSFFLFVRTRAFLRNAMTFGIGFIVGYSPFLAFEMRHGFPNTISVMRFIQTGKDTSFSFYYFLQTVIDVSFRLFARLLFRFPQPEIFVNLPVWQKNIWLFGTSITFWVGLLLLLTVSRWKKSAQLFVLWFGTVVVMFGLYKRAIYDYYFGIFFAFPFFVIALMLSSFRRFRFGAGLMICLWLVLLYYNWQGRPFLYPPNNQLAYVLNIASEAIKKTDGKPFNFALVTQSNSDHAYRYFFEIWGKPPVTIENTVNDPNRQTVTDQLIVICESECKPLGHPLWEIAGFGQAEIVGQWDVPFVKIYKLIHYQENK